MIFKSIRWSVKKEDLNKNAIISKHFVLLPDNKSILFGKVTIEKNNPAVGFGVVLKETDILTNITIDKCFTFTDESGKYYISFYPEDNKLYSILIYKSLNLV
ncbi:hypothetical protein [Paraclostridium bifermentans]|uniref:hypothetical protein n=1 Tax=Paraclostridium bifermentans TaxID=1490 RepID=UPI00359C153F